MKDVSKKKLNSN